MSYRIWLHTSEYRKLELFDTLTLTQFPVEESTKGEEYPDYRIYRDDMLTVLKEYQHLLRDNAKHKMEKDCPAGEHMSHYIQYHYFDKLIENELLVEDSDSFLLQYFYLVELYRKMSHETYFKITHG